MMPNLPVWSQRRGERGVGWHVDVAMMNRHFMPPAHRGVIVHQWL